MKSIIKIISFIIITSFFSTCKRTIEKRQKYINKFSIEVDTLNGHINYSINIANENCIKNNIIASIPINEGIHHLLEIYNEKHQYELFYEYTSVRPVYNKTMYIDKNSLKIDSIVKGFFNFEKIDYDFEKILSDKDICNYNFKKFIK
jgi:hypothetical protein